MPPGEVRDHQRGGENPTLRERDPVSEWRLTKKRGRNVCCVNVKSKEQLIRLASA